MAEKLQLRGLSGDEVVKAVGLLESSLQKGAAQVSGGLPNPSTGRGRLRGYRRPSEGFWMSIVHLEEVGKFSCAFGITSESHEDILFSNNVQTTNPWWTQGAFGTSQDGRSVYFLQFGKEDGRNEFAKRFTGQRARVKWDRYTGEYLVVAKLGDAKTAAQVGEFVKIVARFKGGGALEEGYRNEFEEGLLEAIRTLEGRLGGADVAPVVQPGPNSGPQVGGPSGALNPEDVSAAKERLIFLRQLDDKLRLDPYLLAEPLRHITESVHAARLKQFAYSVGASILSIIAGWLLSSINPGSLFGLGHGFVSTLAQLIPLLPR